ncbi:MAG: hypothetical protein EA377_00015 [Phycisphaerales bacterium]|nr:MAG: hypothetical protein EA377_00015 [Phycisphaerales bacterium]
MTVTDRELLVTGVASGGNQVAEQVVNSSRNGFPWQASIGASADEVVFVPKGKEAVANGRNVPGPVYVAKKTTLNEISFVALGADRNTNARVAAGASGTSGASGGGGQSTSRTENNSMEFETWLEAQGFDPEKLSDEQRTSLEKLFEASSPGNSPAPASGKSGDSSSGAASQSNGQANASAATGGELQTAISSMRAEYVADLNRIQAIQDICSGGGDEHRAIASKAIAEGWNTVKTELEVLRASRPKAPYPGLSGGSKPFSQNTLEAAACLSAGLDENELTKDYGEKTMDAAHPLRHIGLRELVAECARLEGHDVPRIFGDGTETIRAGFSTMSLPGILENVMHKTMLAAYRNTAIAAFDLCSVGSVSDFKEITRYRLLGTGGFEKVAPDGELKHGKLDEQKYTNKADTYGQILTLTRHDIINDDLGAFMDIPRQMGRSGAESIDDLFFTLLLSNPASFFSTGNKNYLTGVDTAFGPDSLTVAKTLFRKQKAGPGNKAKDQKPINIRPELLVVPVEVETDAELLMGSAQIMIDGSDSQTKIPTDNPHRRKYRVISVPHLSDDYYTGASGKAWYLFANPSVVPAFELVFLNGRRTPTIERIETAPNTLGMGFRGYIDVGVKEQDPRGAVKVKGEA